MEERNNDEIDLIELSRNMMVRVYHYVLRRFKMLTIFATIGGILGIGVYFKNKNRYENNIKMISNSVSPMVLVALFNSLDDIRKSDDEAFCKVMNISNDKSNSVLLIEADTLSKIRYDNKQVVSVSIMFDQDLNLDNLSEQFKKYIEENEYVARKIKLRKRSANILIEKYSQEIQKLDSLQSKILASSSQSNASGKLLVLDDKPINFFHEDIIKLEKNIIAERNTLDVIEGCTIIDKSRGVKVKNISLIKTVANYIGILFALGFVITIVLEFNRQVKNIQKGK